MVLYSKFAYGFQFSGGEKNIFKMIHGCQDIKQKLCLILFGTPCWGSIMIYMSWRISLDISLSTYHFWYVTLAISLLTYHYWHVNLYFSILICYSCLVTIDLSLLMCLLTCHFWHVTLDLAWSVLTCHETVHDPTRPF